MANYFEGNALTEHANDVRAEEIAEFESVMDELLADEVTPKVFTIEWTIRNADITLFDTGKVEFYAESESDIRKSWAFWELRNNRKGITGDYKIVSVRLAVQSEIDEHNRRIERDREQLAYGK